MDVGLRPMSNRIALVGGAPRRMKATRAPARRCFKIRQIGNCQLRAVGQPMLSSQMIQKSALLFLMRLGSNKPLVMTNERRAASMAKSPATERANIFRAVTLAQPPD